MINKNHLMNRHPAPVPERMGSPININNYINIYTSKSPARTPQLNYSSPTNGIGQNQGKKPISFGGAGGAGGTGGPGGTGGTGGGGYGASFEKNVVNSSYKNHHSYGSSNPSLERAKFNSLDKPVVHGTHGPASGSFLRNAYYQNASPAGRGYLSNFRERMNPSQKVKKTYKAS